MSEPTSPKGRKQQIFYKISGNNADSNKFVSGLLLEILSDVVLVIIQEWNPKRGFGFVRLPSGRRAFVHVSELRPYPPCGTDLTGHKIDEQSFQVVETEKGLQLENVRIVLTTVWSLEGGVIVSEVIWPQSNRIERGLYPIVYRFRGKPPRYDQQRAEMAIWDGCPPEIVLQVKNYYEALRVEYDQK